MLKYRRVFVLPYLALSLGTWYNVLTNPLVLKILRRMTV